MIATRPTKRPQKPLGRLIGHLYSKRSVTKQRRTTFTFLVICYTCLISVWFVLWLTIADANWWLILLNRVVPYLFVPVPILLVLALYFHRFKILIPLFIPVMVFSALYHPYLFPRLPKATNSRVLTVMTYNVLFSNFDDEAVADIILTYQPDFVALQEVQPGMMKALEEHLQEEYPFSMMGSEHQYGTTAVLSRHPVTESYVLDLEVDRPAVVIKTEQNNTEVTFISAHLLAYGLWWVELEDIPDVVMERTKDQNRQARLLLEEAEKHSGVVIIGCDCNSKETSSSHRIMVKTMNNAARFVGLSFQRSEVENAKQDIDLQHIDYVFYQGQLEPKNVYTIQEDGGSDHMPVLAIFGLE